MVVTVAMAARLRPGSDGIVHVACLELSNNLLMVTEANDIVQKRLIIYVCSDVKCAVFAQVCCICPKYNKHIYRSFGILVCDFVSCNNL